MKRTPRGQRKQSNEQPADPVGSKPSMPLADDKRYSVPEPTPDDNLIDLAPGSQQTASSSDDKTVQELQHQIMALQLELNRYQNTSQANQRSGPLVPVAVQPPSTTTQSTATVNTFAYLTPSNHFPEGATTVTMPSMSGFVETPLLFARTDHQLMGPRKVQDLPKFRGHPEDWPIFYTMYTQSTAIYQYSNWQNCQRLQRALKGEAREVVRALLIHPDNVLDVMEQLKFRFGCPEQLIRSQLQQIRKVAPIPETSIEKLIPFATKAKNLAAFLKSVNGEQHIANPTLLEELVSKLAMSKRLEWARYAVTIQPYATIINFSDWLSEIAHLVCIVTGSLGEPGAEPKRLPVLHTVKENHVCKCLICQGPHKVCDCKRFLELQLKDRWENVKRARLCFTCLKFGHTTRDCRSRKPCRVNGCKRTHHKLLHDNVSTTPNRGSTLTPECDTNNDGGLVLSCVTKPASEKAEKEILFRVLPVSLYGPKGRVTIHALLDEGSSVTLMDLALLAELGLQGQGRSLNIQWVSGKTAQEPAILVDVDISGGGKTKRHKLRNVYAISNLHLPTQSFNCLSAGRSGVRGFSVCSYTDVTPRLLIGLDNCHLGLPREKTQLSINGPFAAKTELGWVVFGPTGKSSTITPACFLIQQHDDALHKLVANYFETETFGIKPSPLIETAKNARARNILQRTRVRINERFQVGLLWKNDEVKLPDSYKMAMDRLVGIEKKMKRDDQFAAAYKGIIQSYCEKGYARKLQPLEADTVGPRTWYLPHFAVRNPNKPDKIRLVFDAAAMVNGISLNSNLLKGAQEYHSMPSVLFNFRIGVVAVCGDIKEMFHQVLIQPEDRSSQRFLWRDGNENKQPDVFEMMVMTFGASCSPCSAQHVKKRNALQHRNNDPRAIASIIKHHYVDGLVDSFESVSEAIRITTEVRDIHKNAGFELRRFSSNSADVLRALYSEPVDMNENRVCLEGRTPETEKILGMFWQPLGDTFGYVLNFHRVNKDVICGHRGPTKRELLSVVMSVFDPLGLLCHLMIAAKILMREVWRHEIRWEEPLTSELNDEWGKWRQLLDRLQYTQVPRHYNLHVLPSALELHVFVDASQDAFAAVAYWRSYHQHVSAKTRCAPIKLLTIPRLELQAAVLGTRLKQSIIDGHALKVNRCILWSDSKTVINWIRSKHRRYKPFVAHRIAEILATTEAEDWRWLPTGTNIADEATRINYKCDLSSSSRWFRGPEFLRQEEESWPAEVNVTDCPNKEEEEEENRPRFDLHVVPCDFINFSRFSSLQRLRRSVAWAIRFINRCRGKRDSSNSLTIDELKQADVLLWRRVQREAYSEEISTIDRGEPLSKGNCLRALTPYMDAVGVLRVYGRIDAASWLPYDVLHPVILPPDHYYTELVATHHHNSMKHKNLEATIGEIRRQFWIPRLRRVLKKTITNCYVCRIARASPVPPITSSVSRASNGVSRDK